jgi:hypothetical protein
MTKVWRIECRTTFSFTLYKSDEQPTVCPIDGCTDFSCELDSEEE